MWIRRNRTSRIEWREAGGLLVLFLIAMSLWNTPILFPLRTLVVFFHEISHGVAALLTGGSIIQMQITPGSGGLCITRGGWTIVVLSAGYVGSMVCGGLLLVLSSKRKLSVYMPGVIGAVLCAVTVIWVRPILGGGFLFGGMAGVLFLACAVWLPEYVNAVIVKAIGLTSCLYAFVDVTALFRHGSDHVSDATLLADVTWLPAWFWALFWLVVSLGMGWWLLNMACRRPVASRPLP